MLGFEVGDLVTLKSYCKEAGRLAILTAMADGYDACKIQWIDEQGLASPIQAALITNLKKVTEDHGLKDG